MVPAGDVAPGKKFSPNVEILSPSLNALVEEGSISEYSGKSGGSSESWS